MPETETPFLKLIKPEISGSDTVWGNRLNTDLDKLDTGVQAVHMTAGAAIYRGRPLIEPDVETEEQKRTISQILLYADDVVQPTDRPGMLTSASFVRTLINTLLPIGTVIQWAGNPALLATAAVPASAMPHWALCNGQTVNSNLTPNLTSKFVVAALPGSPSYDQGMSGGVATHQHGFVTNGTVLTKDQLPAVRPQLDYPYATGAVIARVTSGGSYSIPGGGASDGWRLVAMDHLGIGQAHNHNGTSDAATNIPPYYSICFIMKVKDI